MDSSFRRADLGIRGVCQRTSRGIGLELVRQLLQCPLEKVKTVVAITRNKDSAALNDLTAHSHGRLVNVAISDLTDEKTIHQALPEIEKALPDEGLDVLLNVAGVSDVDLTDKRDDLLARMSIDSLTDVFKTNVGIAHAMTAALLPLLKAGKQKTVLNMSTGVCSITNAERFAQFPNFGYKVSKAALNMLTKQWALQYGKDGFIIFAMSPGWIKTELGTDHADLTVEQGAHAVLERLWQVDSSDNGKFLNTKVPGMDKYKGGEIPW